MLQQLQQDVFLAAEVEVVSPLGVPGGGPDVLYLGFLVAALGKNAQGSLYQQSTRLLLLRLPGQRLSSHSSIQVFFGPQRADLQAGTRSNSRPERVNRRIRRRTASGYDRLRSEER